MKQTSNKLKQTIYGPVVTDSCEACGEDSVWLLAKASEEVALFGAVIWNKNTEYTMVCALCGYGIGLHKSLFQRLIPIAQKNAPKAKVTAKSR